MVGLCGIIGDTVSNIDRLVRELQFLGNEKTTTQLDPFQIGYVDHELEFDTQPATTTAGENIWVWGSVLGHEHKGKYTPREFTQSDASYCAKLYDTYGLDFITGLNSEFSGVIYHPNTEHISIFTDRLGCRPIYYTYTDEGALVFASLISALEGHPDIELSIDDQMLVECLAYGRAFGIETPVDGVKMLPPGSVATFSIDGIKQESWTYWWPTPQPRERPQSVFVERFNDVFQDAVDERCVDAGVTGLLLSGGTDSRIILDALDGDVTAFHMNERLEENYEARTARRVAETTGAEFEFLQRDVEYYPRVLDSVEQLVNFNGRFDHMHTLGFTDEIRKETDLIFSGHYGDTILTGHHVPRSDFDSTLSRHLTPYGRPASVGSAEEYLELFRYNRITGNPQSPGFLCAEVSPLATVESSLEVINEQIRFHGVEYSSWDAFLQFGMIYPISNTFSFSFYESLVHTVPARTPFLDNRIVDLALEMAIETRWKDIVSDALSHRSKPLSSIPHPSTRVPPRYSKAVSFYAGKIAGIIRRIPKPEQDTSDLANPIQRVDSGGPWPNFDELVRVNPFIKQCLTEHELELRESSVVDYDQLERCYESQIRGENHWQELFALATVLASSVPFQSDSNELT